MADIHANIEALDFVLYRLKAEGVLRFYVCGDVVGYGRNPNECCYRLQHLKALVLAGNHDRAVTGQTRYQDNFSRSAIEAIEYTRKTISDFNLRWLEKLPLYHHEGNLEFVHASLHEPEKWPYLTNGIIAGINMWQDVRKCFEAMKGRVCFAGHSHRPAVYLQDKSGKVDLIDYHDDSWINLSGKKAVVDVGSVGSPRDSRNFGSAAVFDPDDSRLKMLRIPI